MMSIPTATSWYEEGINCLNPTTKMSVEPVNLYPKETVEHLVDQLIKLNQEYNRQNGTQGITYKQEIDKAMKTINKALELSLTFRLVQTKISE